ncbi:hypothetical protein GUITHDRAFT_136738 [Guillardia theta CCMP2712]|uniref:Armadillo repeat-containing domain-containing protein n=1 Tax=Guillardia theta (strain CCMP2712) TaxID=905079 RepID=L1JI66_GUITC|nr:hypothetical protein GUITHDRAFT_136738 [Guillardia theta CCMP2712]EKX48196.1 hypothetical protein GUITHDRAFT_136738 [Guillardia theta CCMP2712]|eukprot:XP_005835176.1 hypothetical protein GUITHDRAFT_136738 [Guillardia theta CCMP2712]
MTADETRTSFKQLAQVFPRSKTIQCYGAGILWKVSLFSQEWKDKIVSLDGIRIVCECLKFNIQCHKCCQHCCWLLSSLAYKNYSRCEVIAQCNAIELITDMLKLHSKHVYVLEAGFSVLNNLSLKRELTGSDSNEMMIANEESQRRMQIDSLGGVQLLADALQIHKNKKFVVRKAVSALSYLCIGEEEIFEKLIERGSLKDIFCVLETHTKDKKVSRNCLALLGHILNNPKLLLQVLRGYSQNPAVLTYFYEMIARNLETDKFDEDWRNQFGQLILENIEMVLSHTR